MAKNGQEWPSHAEWVKIEESLMGGALARFLVQPDALSLWEVLSALPSLSFSSVNRLAFTLYFQFKRHSLLTVSI